MSAALAGADQINRRYLWHAMQAASLPDDWRATLYREAERNRHATLPLSLDTDWLAERCALLRRVSRQGVQLDATSDDIAERARDLAAQCWDSVQREGGEGGARLLVQLHTRREWPGLTRATCGRWWKRALNARTDAVTEEAARALGHVGGRSKSYVSEQTHSRKVNQRRRNQRAVEAASIVDANGECCDLKVAVEASVANPKVRRAELMTRIRGSEEIATGHGLIGLMVTTTNASRFHPVRADGTRNDLWHGATVREAQDDQLAKWARVRARWHADGLRVFGMRVAEPHKSGTPHWHLLMFVAPEDLRRVVAHLLRVFRADDRDVPTRAALKYRVKVEIIDTAKGTAAAYCAKYVSKNIDGYGLEEHEKSNARRVRSWASAHRIRQFQFFGGPPVGVWRESRRIDEKPENMGDSAALAAVVVAVNRRDEEKADWAAYVRANGGLWCRRADRPVRLARDVRPQPAGAYGDERQPPVVGVEDDDGGVPTRERKWSIVWGGIGRRESRTRVNNCNSQKSWRVPVGGIRCLTRFNFLHPGIFAPPESLGITKERKCYLNFWESIEGSGTQTGQIVGT